MKNSFPVVVCLFGAIADFMVWAWLRRFKVRERPPGSLTHLPVEERQRRIAAARWIVFGSAWFLLAGAVLLYWLERR